MQYFHPDLGQTPLQNSEDIVPLCQQPKLEPQIRTTLPLPEILPLDPKDASKQRASQQQQQQLPSVQPNLTHASYPSSTLHYAERENRSTGTLFSTAPQQHLLQQQQQQQTTTQQQGVVFSNFAINQSCCCNVFPWKWLSNGHFFSITSATCGGYDPPH